MTNAIQRRLGRLDSESVTGLGDIPAILEAGRQRARGMTLEEQALERAARLAGMRAQHAERPLRGLALLMLEGLEHAAAQAG